MDAETEEFFKEEPRVEKGQFWSDLLWNAMVHLKDEVDWVSDSCDWTDKANFSAVEERMKKIANEIDPSADLEYALDYARKNWETYQKLRKEGKLEDGGESLED